MTVRLNGMEILTEGGLRQANQQMLPGLTITGTGEMALPSKLAIPGNTLTPCTRLRLVQYGISSSVGLLPTITPRIRLGGVLLLPARAISGLLGASDVPWYSVADFLVLQGAITGAGILFVDDNQVRLFGGKPVVPPDLSVAQDLTSSAQWSTTGNSIICQAWIANITPPAA
ncbi:hypothetical protein QO001_000848 [Methylobacterium brachiatum]|uniref:Uncharacterized protein n=1 Tax=Methylobacterium brachiatum TaxID=269660 RepID=A0AAJ1TJ38_9HYPH|nr:hypothetical protein [Methylobacterium brachiatum]MCB4803503.1 hypothetical protein [Methylobacterium brachiatum]MDQ0541940.1 hypothetical protein [Methylobacterium brachiatum]